MNKKILLVTCLLAISSPALGQEGEGDAPDGSTPPVAAPTGDQATAPAETTPAAKIDPKCDCLKQCISTKQLDFTPMTSVIEAKFKSSPFGDLISSDKDVNFLKYVFGEGVSAFSTLNVPELKKIQEACSYKGNPGIGNVKQCLSTISGDLPDLGNSLKQFVNETIDSLVTGSRDLPVNVVNMLNECKVSCSAEDNLTCPFDSFRNVKIIGGIDILGAD